MGMAALHNKFPDARGKEQAAFLLNHGDALRASARTQRMNHEAVEKNASGKGVEDSGNQLKERGLPAGIGSENGHDLAGARVKARGFESEERGLRRICGVGVADLLDGETDFR